MANGRIYGIRYPFTDNNEDGRYIDVNKTLDEKIASEILHVVLTQKRTRLRMPNFGTNLIKYVFEDNTSSTWDAIHDEIVSAVSAYVPDVTIVHTEIDTREDEEHSIYLIIRYQVRRGNSVENKEIIAKL